MQANSLGYLEQIKSYAPGHQVRFGSLNYTADIHVDLIFDAFEPMSGVPHSHDEHDITLSSDSIWEITSATTSAVNPEQIMPSQSGGIYPATEAAHSAAIELNTDFTSYETCVTGPLNSSQATGSEPPASVPIQSD